MGFKNIPFKYLYTTWDGYNLVNKFILRRTNAILSKHLPPKVVEVVCCKLGPLQSQLYTHFLESKTAKAALTGKHTMAGRGAQVKNRFSTHGF